MRRKMTPTGNLTREEWLQLRRNGIGGSDASVIMGKNPYRSILQLWEEKTGKLPVTDNGNEFTYWGNVMEPIIRKEFMNRTGLKVRQLRLQKRLLRPHLQKLLRQLHPQVRSCLLHLPELPCQLLLLIRFQP